MRLNVWPSIQIILRLWFGRQDGFAKSDLLYSEQSIFYCGLYKQYIYTPRSLSQLYTAPQDRYAVVPLILAAGDAPSSPDTLIGKHLSSNGFSNVYSASQLASSSDQARNYVHTKRLVWNRVPASSIPPGPNFPLTLRSSEIVTSEVTLSPVLEAPAVCEQTPAWSVGPG